MLWLSSRTMRIICEEKTPSRENLPFETMLQKKSPFSNETIGAQNLISRLNVRMPKAEAESKLGKFYEQFAVNFVLRQSRF
jgi:hypothetical protein